MRKPWMIAAITLGLIDVSAASERHTPVTCEQLAQVAEFVMTKRQANEPIAPLIPVSVDSQATQEIIREAYAEPVHRTPEMQRRAIADFTARWRGCVLKPDSLQVVERPSE